MIFAQYQSIKGGLAIKRIFAILFIIVLTNSILVACSNKYLEYKSFIVVIEHDRIEYGKDIRLISNYNDFKQYQLEERTHDYANEQVLLEDLKYNEVYFENNDLIIILHSSPSSQITYIPKEVEIDNDNLNVIIKSCTPKNITTDGTIWLFYIELEKQVEEVSSISYEILE
ncbi:MAG: hypothetical protein CVV59_01670 [Tenericutes bacterium HGW-Tenericutes-4]|nr:MAG: hypothetical protein CVV59_01670 [Tenericutes bacterium HGW-Tenericutes-4]